MRFDLSWAREVENYCAAERARLLASGPSSQIDFALLGQVAGDLGLVRLLLVAPAAEVRALLGEAAAALEQLFALRGSEPAFEASAAERGDVDDSLANRATARRAMLFALAAGDAELARRIAVATRAAGLSMTSPTEAALASALAALLLDQRPELEAALARLDDDAEARALRALARRDGAALAHALEMMARQDERRALDQEDATNPEVLTSLPALALAGEAVRRGTVSAELLPERLRRLL